MSKYESPVLNRWIALKGTPSKAQENWMPTLDDILMSESFGVILEAVKEIEGALNLKAGQGAYAVRFALDVNATVEAEARKQSKPATVTPAPVASVPAGIDPAVIAQITAQVLAAVAAQAQPAKNSADLKREAALNRGKRQPAEVK